jgi:hypothetical protein
MSPARGFPTNAPTSAGGGSYEQAQQHQGEPHGPTYDMVMSDKLSGNEDAQDPHYLGQLMPVAHSRNEEVRGFFDATSVMD